MREWRESEVSLKAQPRPERLCRISASTRRCRISRDDSRQPMERWNRYQSRNEKSFIESTNESVH
jgi:hypothetical protein